MPTAELMTGLSLREAERVIGIYVTTPQGGVIDTTRWRMSGGEYKKKLATKHICCLQSMTLAH